MKTKFVLLGTLVALLLLQACSESKFDYRHKYVGDYDAQIQWREEMTHLSSNGYDLPATAIVDFGDGKDQLQLTLNIDAFPPLNIAMTVDREGGLHASTVEGFSGHFSDKRKFYIEYQTYTPVEEHYYWQIKGSKH